ncbi:MAG: HEAT repeat domain-containing protein [Planctomycetes bacterium]|nr:HEAT repeat domain-containing protein [Planctomycetota bacterium]
MFSDSLPRARRAALGLLGAVLGAAPLAAHGGRYFGPVPTVSTPPAPPGTGARTPTITPGVNPLTPPNVPGGMSPTGPFTNSWENWWELNYEWVLSPRTRAPREQVDDGPTSSPHGTRIPSRELVRERVLPVLRAHLKDRDAEVRSAAAMALGKTALRDVEPELIALLDDPERDVREGALLGLGLLRTPVAQQTLLARFADAKRTTRERAFSAAALGLLGSSACLQALLDALDPTAAGKKEGRTVQGAALLGLAAGASTATLPRLMPWVEGQAFPDDMIGALACSVLGRIGDRSAIPAVEKALLSKEGRIRQGACFAIASLAKPTDSALLKKLEHVAREDALEDVRAFAWLALGRIGGEPARALLRKELAESRSAVELGYASLGLGFCGDPDLDGPRLARERVERGGDVNLRAAAAIAIGILGAKGQASVLAREMASNQNRDFATGLILGLGLLRADNAAKALLANVARERAPEVLRASIISLGLLDHADLLETVSERLARERSSVLRGAGAQGLGTVMDARHLDTVLELLAEKKPVSELRVVLIVALGRMAEPQDLPALSALRRDLWFQSDDAVIQELLSIL